MLALRGQEGFPLNVQVVSGAGVRFPLAEPGRLLLLLGQRLEHFLLPVHTYTIQTLK